MVMVDPLLASIFRKVKIHCDWDHLLFDTLHAQLPCVGSHAVHGTSRLPRDGSRAQVLFPEEYQNFKQGETAELHKSNGGGT